MKNELYQKEESKHFYEDRYEKGYMEEWPVDRKQRVFELVRSLRLPESGIALDFGCGNGVFTDVLMQALPMWQIFGCDISSTAINNAKIRFPRCTFFVSDNEHSFEMKFDFLFSHHVLEHVFDIKKTITEINNYLKPKSFIFHIFPCGNENSFEYKVCKMRTDGINADMENRFFFEDEGHVRRLTTEQTSKLMNEYGFVLENDFYSNQYYGAIKWISQSSREFILEFTNSEKSIDKKAYMFLKMLRFKLLLFFILQMPAQNKFHLLRGRKINNYFKWVIKTILYYLSYPVYSLVNSNAKKEWNINKHLKNGSEMYLFYNRK